MVTARGSVEEEAGVSLERKKRNCARRNRERAREESTEEEPRGLSGPGREAKTKRPAQFK